MIKIVVVGDPHPFTPTQEKRMRKTVRDSLEKTGQSGRSASGKTIAFAVEYCEEHKLAYTLKGSPYGYFLSVGAEGAP